MLRTPTPSLRSLALGLLVAAAGCGADLPADDPGDGVIAQDGTEDTTLAPMAASAAADEVLRLVNQARAVARTCGTQSYPAAAPLKANALLAAAAQGHSQDMVTHNFFSHTGSDGSAPWDRMTRRGYRWSAAGENIAAGYTTPATAVAAWLKSAGHCANIMNARFVDSGVGLATGGTYRYYWTQDFGRPR